MKTFTFAAALLVASTVAQNLVTWDGVTLKDMAGADLLKQTLATMWMFTGTSATNAVFDQNFSILLTLQGTNVWKDKDMFESYACSKVAPGTGGIGTNFDCLIYKGIVSVAGTTTTITVSQYNVFLSWDQT